MTQSPSKTGSLSFGYVREREKETIEGESKVQTRHSSEGSSSVGTAVDI